jgi:hypothetical protein
VAFLEDLPGNVSDQSGERSKKKFSFVHERGLPQMEGQAMEAL